MDEKYLLLKECQKFINQHIIENQPNIENKPVDDDKKYIWIFQIFIGILLLILIGSLMYFNKLKKNNQNTHQNDKEICLNGFCHNFIK